VSAEDQNEASREWPYTGRKGNFMKSILVNLLLVIAAACSGYSQTNDARTIPEVAASERIISDEVIQNTQEILRNLHLNLEQLNVEQLQQQIEQELERVNASIPEIKEIIDGVLSQQEEIRQQIEHVHTILPEINMILEEVQGSITRVLQDLKVEPTQ
jgi:predicted ribosome quality control (RQC) complex YloA/Tae2 family protein